MNKNINKTIRSIIVARGVVNQSENKVSEQIEEARRYCRSLSMNIVDAVTLENRSANDQVTEDALEALLVRKAHQNDYDVLIVSDLSRLSRQGICHATAMLNRFDKAGIRIVTLDGGGITPALFNTVKFHVPRKKKVLDQPHGKKNSTNHPVHRSPDDARRKDKV